MIVFHRFLIGTFILFSLGFAWWSFHYYQTVGGSLALAMAAFFILAAAAFGYYLKHLLRFLGR
ncbi:MAG: hypothetical protein E2O47_02215 [Gemmatimonadetes bacterium]|nr:hypothetical protein [Gemmatimonadota bacterium]TDJ56403.1 MAG: hypothetical protein E2O47_02215 [Gemmatimonadota bacterium]